MNRTAPVNPLRPRGTTVVELIIALTIFIIALAAIYQIVSTSENAVYTTSVQSDLDTKAHQIVDRIANDVKDGIASSFVVNGAHDSLDFKKLIGFDSTTGSKLASNNINYSAESLTNSSGRQIYCLTRTVVDAHGATQKSVLADYLTGDPAAVPPLPALGPNPPGQAVYFEMPDPHYLTITVTLERTNAKERMRNPTDRARYAQTSTASTTIRVEN